MCRAVARRAGSEDRGVTLLILRPSMDTGAGVLALPGGARAFRKPAAFDGMLLAASAQFRMAIRRVACEASTVILHIHAWMVQVAIGCPTREGGLVPDSVHR